MLSFLVRRVALGVLVMWCVTVVVFLIFYVGPGAGDVARTLAGRVASPATVALIAHHLLLDRPWYVQYGHFLSQLLHGNLGFDYYNNEAVSTIIGQAFPVTLSLIVGAAPLWLAMGVLSGVYSAVRPRSLLDRLFTGIALLFYSTPTFVLGVLLILVLYYELTVHGVSIFPPPGFTPLTQNPFDWFRDLILPWLTLALVLAAAYTRLARSALHPAAGPAGHHRRRHRRRGRGGGGEHRRRHALRRDRPQGPAALT